MNPRNDYRLDALIGDLAALSAAVLDCRGCGTLSEVAADVPLGIGGDGLLDLLLRTRFTNNGREADLLHRAVLEPEAMTADDLEAAEPFAAFLAFAAPVIVAANEADRAFDNAVHPGDTGHPARFFWHMDDLRVAFPPAIAALATLIGDIAAGRVTLPPFDPRIIAERAATSEAHRVAVIAAGGALGNRSQAFAPSKLPPLAADPGDAERFPWAAFAPASSASPSTDAASDPDEAFELAEARVIAADAALVEARAAVTSALCEISGRRAYAFRAVVADTEAARRAACDAERQRDVTEGEADELGPDAFAEALGAAADKLSSAHLALLNFSLREADFVGDALSSLE